MSVQCWELNPGPHAGQPPRPHEASIQIAPAATLKQNPSLSSGAAIPMCLEMSTALWGVCKSSETPYQEALIEPEKVLIEPDSRARLPELQSPGGGEQSLFRGLWQISFQNKSQADDPCCSTASQRPRGFTLICAGVNWLLSEPLDRSLCATTPDAPPSVLSALFSLITM